MSTIELAGIVGQLCYTALMMPNQAETAVCSFHIPVALCTLLNFHADDVTCNSLTCHMPKICYVRTLLIDISMNNYMQCVMHHYYGRLTLYAPMTKTVCITGIQAKWQIKYSVHVLPCIYYLL